MTHGHVDHTGLENSGDQTNDALDLSPSLFDPATFAAGLPHERFRQLRINDPCHWSGSPTAQGCWNVVRHEDVVACLKDWETYSSHTGGTTIEDQNEEQVQFNRSLLHVDPPEHTRMRRAFAGAFGRRDSAGYSSLFEAVAEPLVDEVLAMGTFDAVSDLAAKLVAYSLWKLLGGPDENRDYFLRLSALMLGDMVPRAGVVDYAQLEVPAGAARWITGSPSQAMATLLESLASERRSAVEHHLVDASSFRDAGATDLEIADLEIILATAGTGMTQNAITTTLRELALDWDRLDPGPAGANESISGLVEEGLRMATPLIYVRRTATRDHSLHERVIRANDKVIVWLASANFDERPFPDPLRFDPTRDPNPHVSFGRGGPHFCLGAWLAREEMSALLRVLLRRARRLTIVEPPVRTPSSFVNEMSQLVLSIEPRGTV